VPPKRLLTREEKRVKAVNDNLRTAIFLSSEPQSAVTRQLLRDSEDAENPERPRLMQISGYHAAYASSGKLRPESAFSPYSTRGGRIKPAAEKLSFEDEDAAFRKQHEALESLQGRQIEGTVPQLCSWDKIDVIRSMPVSPEEEEKRKKDEALRQSEIEWQRLQSLLHANDPEVQEVPICQPVESKNDSGETLTSSRGTNTKYGKMYCVGTSKCCGQFNCDPTRCVHIIQDSAGYRGEAYMKEDGKKRLHTVTVYYEATHLTSP